MAGAIQRAQDVRGSPHSLVNVSVMRGNGDGQRLGIAGYEQFELLGVGGFSRVWKAYQPRFQRFVAIKLLMFDVVDDAAIRSFESECHAMGQVSAHPNIVTVLDSGVSENDQPFIVMEYFEGGTISDRLAAGPISLEEILRVGVKISGALQTAHDARILHRDIKPHNIFVSRFGEPALGDFGISKIDQERTATGFAGYTVHYAPPEVLDGRPASVQSDLYSLGATWYRLIGGLRPFDGPNQSVVATAVRVITDPTPTITNPQCPPRLKELVETLMSKDPADRPPSAAGVAAEFQAIQEEAGFRVTDVILAPAHTNGSDGAMAQDSAPTVLRSATGASGANQVPTADAEPDLEDALRSTDHSADDGKRDDVSLSTTSSEVQGSDEMATADSIEDLDLDATIARSSLVTGGALVSGEHVATLADNASGKVERDTPTESVADTDDGLSDENETKADDVLDEPDVRDIDDPEASVRESAGAAPIAGESAATHSGTNTDSPNAVDAASETEDPEEAVAQDSLGLAAERDNDTKPDDAPPTQEQAEEQQTASTSDRRSRFPRVAALSVIVAVAAALSLLAFVVVSRQDQPESEATPSSQTTVAASAAPTPSPPAGVQVEFLGNSKAEVVWSPTGGRDNDLYRVTLDGAVKSTATSSIVFSNIGDLPLCASVVRVRDGASSLSSVACTENPVEVVSSDPTDVALEDLSIGDCVVEDTTEFWDDTVEVVDCASPHKFEVVLSGAHPEFARAFETEGEVADRGSELCESEFEPYVGVAYEVSEYYFASWYLGGTEEVEEGRELLCYVFKMVNSYQDIDPEAAILVTGAARASSG